MTPRLGEDHHPADPTMTTTDDVAPSLARPLPHVALIELNRPEAANRLQPDDLSRLLAHLDAVDRDPEIRALVLASRGSHFCTGYDLRALVADRSTGDASARGERLRGRAGTDDDDEACKGKDPHYEIRDQGSGIRDPGPRESKPG